MNSTNIRPTLLPSAGVNVTTAVNSTSVNNSTINTNTTTILMTSSAPSTMTSQETTSPPTVKPSTTASSTTAASVCPDLREMMTRVDQTDPASSKFLTPILSTTQRVTGTVVKAQCPSADPSNEAVYLLCQASGQWNSTLPQCTGHYDLSSYKLFFAVGGAALGLIVVVLSVIYCSLLKDGRKKRSRGSSRHSEIDIKQVDPYHIGEPLYGRPSLVNSTSGNRSSLYAKPAVFSTYLNPSFYEESYDRWRKQEDAEKIYDSPWPKQRGLKSQMDAENFKWSQSSLKTISESGFQKLPRGVVSVDQISFSSEESAGQESTTKSVDHLLASRTSSQGQTLHGVKRYRRMKSREFASGTLPGAAPSPPTTSTTMSKESSRDRGNLMDSDSTIGLTML